MIPPGLVWECFVHFAGLDVSNAAVHTAPVRYSPLTFRLAEALTGETDPRRHAQGNVRVALLADVLAHRGRYLEDRGRE